MPPERTLDALIVASAVAGRAEHMISGDRRDIERLADGDLEIIPV
jgi:hypothetical protein